MAEQAKVNGTAGNATGTPTQYWYLYFFKSTYETTKKRFSLSGWYSHCLVRNQGEAKRVVKWE